MRLQSSFAGTFYPGSTDELRRQVEQLLRDGPTPPQMPLGALVPHAGYVYSGRTAGLAVSALQSARARCVVLLGPSHRVPIEGAAILDVDGYETPLGPVPTDRDVADRLQAFVPELQWVPAFPEHSLEVQLPLLRSALPSATVLALAFGWPDAALAKRLGSNLARLAEEQELLIVASSDLSHYHDHRTALRLDQKFRELLLRGIPEDLIAAVDRQETEACGVGPVLTLMHYGRARQAHFEIVDQRDSSSAFGDESQVVGYLSALLLPGETVRSADRA